MTMVHFLICHLLSLLVKHHVDEQKGLETLMLSSPR